MHYLIGVQIQYIFNKNIIDISVSVLRSIFPI